MLGKIKNFFKTLLSNMTPTRLFVYLMAFSAIVYFTVYAIIGNGYYLHIFFRDSRDFFMDFLNSIRDASNVDTVYSESNVIYPPMANLLFLIFSRFTPDVYNATSFNERYDWVNYAAPFMLIVITTLLFGIILFALVKSQMDKYDKKLAAFFAAFALFNVPVLYMIERGNILMFSLISLMMFAFSYNSESKVARELGLIALAFSFSIKLYPVIFGWMLIKDKRFKEALRCAIYGILMVILPSFAFGGFIEVCKLVVRNIFSFSSSGGSGNIFSQILGFFGVEYVNVDFMSPIMWIWAALVCLCFVVAPFVIEEKWKVYTIGVLAIICIPSLTSLYAWSFMLIPMIFFCRKKEFSRLDWFYFTVMILPFIFIPWRFQIAITNNGLVLYFCAAILSVSFVIFTVRSVISTVKQNKAAGITLKQYLKSLVTAG